MRNIQLIGVILVIIGSFLPLVHIPIIGSWNYYDIDKYLAGFCWLLSLVALWAAIKNKIQWVNVVGFLLMVLFVFTIFAIKFKSLDFFSFLHFNTLKEFAAGMIKLSWGWFILFLGAFLLVFSTKFNNSKS